MTVYDTNLSIPTGLDRQKLLLETVSKYSRSRVNIWVDALWLLLVVESAVWDIDEHKMVLEETPNVQEAFDG